MNTYQKPHVLSEMYILHLSHRIARGQCGAKEKKAHWNNYFYPFHCKSTEGLIDIYIVDKSCRLQITRKTASQFKKAWNKQPQQRCQIMVASYQKAWTEIWSESMDCNVKFWNTQQRSRHMRCRFLKAELLPHLHLGPFQNLYIYHE